MFINTEGGSNQRVLVEMEPHYSPSMYRTPLFTTPCRRVYIEVNEDAQVTHAHRVPDCDRFGDCQCECGAWLWSPWWVADGVFGHGTAEWIRSKENRLIHHSMTRHLGSVS